MRYYGGKRKLLEFIYSAATAAGLPDSGTVLDGFTGTSVVARHFKESGRRVVANDALYFAHCLAVTSISFNSNPQFAGLGFDPIKFLNELPGKQGFFTHHYTPLGNRQYLTTSNGERIDAIREQIHIWEISGDIDSMESDFLKGLLIRAVNLVSNVSGTYAAYLKSWDNRALKPLIIQSVECFDNSYENVSVHGDVIEVARNQTYDLAYFDPPYNGRDYASNYFLLDVIANGWFEDEPEVNGLTGMRDNSKLRSRFSSKRTAESALSELIRETAARTIILSYSNEGIVPLGRVTEILREHGELTILAREHGRYRAINHNKTKNTTNENLFVLQRESSQWLSV